MDFEDLKGLYRKKREQVGSCAYKYVSELLREAKEIHLRDWLEHPTPGGDHEQSWRAFKGKNLEKLVQYMITQEVEELGLRVVNGNRLERSTRLGAELGRVKRNLAIDYGEFGLHLPDVDIVIIRPTELQGGGCHFKQSHSKGADCSNWLLETEAPAR